MKYCQKEECIIDYRMSSDLDYMSQDEIDDEDLKMTLETLKSVIWVV